MKSDLLLQVLINMLLVSVVVEGVVSAVFATSSLKSVESKRVVQTTREAITFLVALLFVYVIDSMRIMSASGIKFPKIGDMVISSLILSRFAGFIRDLMYRVRSGI